MSQENIYISSTSPVSYEQIWYESLKEMPVELLTKPEDDKDSIPYFYYQPTHLQFEIISAVVGQNISIRIPYQNRLTRLKAAHSIICIWNPTDSKWEELKTTIDEKSLELKANSNRVGIFCVFVNEYWYSSFTQRLADEYPQWTEIRQNKESTGQSFLNYFGIELEVVKDYLDWIHEQKYVRTADTSVFDWVYMYPLPDIKEKDEIKVYRKDSYGITVEVPVLETLQSFFFNELNDGGIFDYQDNRFYTAYNYGELKFIVSDSTDTIPIIKPIHFHIWNAFDEFGLLLGVKRLHLEKNADFKERILDVFRYPAGSHDDGLTNGIARELNLIQRKDKSGKQIVWHDDTKPLVLKNESGLLIDLHTLRLDDKPLTPAEYMQDEVGNVYIYPRNTLDPHTVSFIANINKYQLYDKDNESLHKLMFNDDGQASSKMLEWVKYINTIAPMMWGHFNWDDAFWDTIDKNLTGIGYVPNIWDSDIECWKTYTIKG